MHCQSYFCSCYHYIKLKSDWWEYSLLHTTPRNTYYGGNQIFQYTCYWIDSMWKKKHSRMSFVAYRFLYRVISDRCSFWCTSTWLSIHLSLHLFQQIFLQMWFFTMFLIRLAHIGSLIGWFYQKSISDKSDASKIDATILFRWIRSTLINNSSLFWKTFEEHEE